MSLQLFNLLSDDDGNCSADNNNNNMLKAHLPLQHLSRATLSHIPWLRDLLLDADLGINEARDKMQWPTIYIIEC